MVTWYLITYLSESYCPNNSLNISNGILSEKKQSAQPVVEAINKWINNNNECLVDEQKNEKSMSQLTLYVA